jgi:outer membrane receptor protein involved in Fe transport
VYLQEVFIPHPRWQFTLGGRFDGWRTTDAFRREQDLQAGTFLRDERFGNRSRQVFNPKAGVLFKAADQLSLRSGLYRSFRAPTLNELFRPFRVRNDITEASETHEPERLSGAELGLDYHAPALSARLTGYWNEVEDMVFNLTVGKGPGQVAPCGFVPEGGLCRQRSDLEKVRIQGVEAEVKAQRGPAWTGSVGYLFTRARAVAATPELEGKRLPQVPAPALTLQLRYSHPARGQVALQGRYTGGQFEDDLNPLELGGFGVVDLSISRPLRRGIEVFLQAENLFDQESEVGISGHGVVSVGAPRQVQFGLRVGR